MHGIDAAPRYLFFAGKGEVGKTSVACATAVALADRGSRVLLVSTDPASNLDDVLEVAVLSTPTAIDAVPRLFALNIDPQAAATAYRAQVLDLYREVLPAEERATLEEHLAGACTVEIAAFAAFARLLSEADVTSGFAHVVFDTAPTGHTLHLIATARHGLVMVTGKGGVGKTTIAAAIATELAVRGFPVHLTTTDPAVHVAATLASTVPGLTVSRIDPAVETEAYRHRALENAAPTLDAQRLALLEEDLHSPCTEEVAVFHAFARLVAAAQREIVVMDTAPTGHTLLLLDATGAYHRELIRKLGQRVVSTPLMRLRDAHYTKVVLVTLPEPTPVLDAAQLQAELRRAGIEPFAWVINGSLAAAGPTDPLLKQRADAELEQIRKVHEQLTHRAVIVPWVTEEPLGPERLRRLGQSAASHIPLR
jgi:anion-transporting  ArsA/GET3 family ATPase